ncbi:MAG: Argininosuccinate lyase [uncultured Thermomicrobiales bacterium]|uniref:Argininosuccinate lyase n=1 Tax=uncultured Thermomicrobiales bacterium TaxID=1645740 RepID=A0A6J4VL59_9BACT|nr:MAG: Argininosuccinate lyase [uncultured Thermomicrobiales bacterium]
MSKDAPTKLWQKGYAVHPLIEEYLTGDVSFDNRLIEADVLGSIAHARMLGKIGLLTAEEVEALTKELARIVELAEAGQFTVTTADEDVHTKIENHLAATVGEAGKRIHTARSRNDQVLVDLRLFTRVELTALMGDLLDTVEALTDFAERGKAIPMPGYTHMQRAMLSSVGLWAAGFAEALLDDLQVLRVAYAINDQSPLGSAASYGVPFDIDRQYVADLLGFAKVQRNVLYAQAGRGKFEGLVVQALAQIMIDLSRLAQDVLLFTTSEYDFFRVAPEMTTGSSIMPQKHNLDVMEIMRGKARTVLAYQQQILETVAGLPSGYNTDFGETKSAFMRALDTVAASLRVLTVFMPGLEPREEQMRAACSPQLFATDHAYALVTSQEMPFRDAYRLIASQLDTLAPMDPHEQLQNRRHIGASGNLGLDETRAQIAAERATVAAQQEKIAAVKRALLTSEA